MGSKFFTKMAALFSGKEDIAPEPAEWTPPAGPPPRHRWVAERDTYFESIQKTHMVTSLINEQSFNSIVDKDTYIVFTHTYRNIKHFFPLLQRLKEDYQIILITFVESAYEKCYGKFFSTRFPVFFLSQYNEYYELLEDRFDIQLLLYALLSKVNVKAILQDEWTGQPMYSFYHGMPKLPNVPPIFCMRHSLSTFYDMPDPMKNYFMKTMTKYFVWGQLHKELFFTKSDKVVAAGYNCLDELKDRTPEETGTIFFVGQHAYIQRSFDERQLLRDLISNTEYSIVYKPHPFESIFAIRNMEEYFSYTDKFMLMDSNASYVDALEKCNLCLSFGSNIVAEALALNKKVCLLDSNYAKDPVYTTTEGKYLLLDNHTPTYRDIVAFIENYHIHEGHINDFREKLCSNLFHSTDVIWQHLEETL